MLRARTAPSRTVCCLHCGAGFTVAAQAMVLTCPSCYKRVTVQDIVINTAQNMARVETCGRVVVRRGGKITAGVVLATVGVEVLGELYAGAVCAPVVHIGPRAVWRGDLSAARVIIEPGARVLSGRFRIQPVPARPAGSEETAA